MSQTVEARAAPPQHRQRCKLRARGDLQWKEGKPLLRHPGARRGIVAAMMNPRTQRAIVVAIAVILGVTLIVTMVTPYFL